MAAPVLATLLALVMPMAGAAPPQMPVLAPVQINGGPAMPEVLVGNWIVTDVADTTLLPGVPVLLEFGATGGVSGKSGCNRFSAALEVNGNDLSPGPARATKMACDRDVMELEAAFHRAFRQLTRYQIDAEGMLVLYGQDVVLMRARRA